MCSRVLNKADERASVASPVSSPMTPPAASRYSWRTVAGVVLGVVVGLAAGELFFRAITDERPPLREAEDGIAAITRGDPTSFVIGSSHARFFIPLEKELAERTGGAERFVVVSLEYGTDASYLWLLRHRLLPLFDETRADGTKVRPSLRRVIVTTNWWDACTRVQGPASTNLPARAWAFGDFVDDLLAHGLTDYNGNYPQNRLNRWFRDSVLVRSRGHEYLPAALRGLIKKKSEAEIRADLERTIDIWRTTAEGAVGCDDPVQRGALDAILTELTARGLDVTLVLSPSMPVTVTELAKRTTMAEFADWARALAERHGVRFLDLATSTPLEDRDWEHDLDHLTASGAQRFSDWMLDGPLADWVKPGPAAPARAATGGAP